MTPGNGQSMIKAISDAARDHDITRVQMLPAKEAASEEQAKAYLTKLALLALAPFMLMSAFGVLARHHVPVPVLGYWDCCQLVLAAFLLVLLLRRARWYS